MDEFGAQTRFRRVLVRFRRFIARYAFICCFDRSDWIQRAKSNEDTMAHTFSVNDDVRHQLQGPQGRANNGERGVYTIITCLPIESDGRPRYRIKSKTENFERVVTEDQLSRPQ
jgi:hypothetical protein